MKAFGFIGLGLYFKNKWAVMTLRVDEEVSIPKEISVPDQKEITLRVPKKLDDVINFLTGIIWCDSTEEAEACLSAFTDKVQSGELTDFCQEVNPTQRKYSVKINSNRNE
jgi:hypothetical protein